MEVRQKAQILISALPYFRDFYGKIMVIKYGGHAMIDENLKKAFAEDIVLMKYVGIKPVIVHGGGPQINKVMERMGLKPLFVEGQRVTDEETMNVVEMVLVGTVNKEIVSLINRAGGKAVGLSGRDGNMIIAEKMTVYKYKGEDHPLEIIDIGRVGKVQKVNPEVLITLLEKSFIPVVAPVGVGPEGLAYNINADLVAGALASALSAEKLIYLSDVEGVKDKHNKLISTLYVDEIEDLIKEEIVKGGMVPKLKSAFKALVSGVKKVHIIDGRIAHSLIIELFTDEGLGTQILKKKAQEGGDIFE